ncbi:MAG: tryptophan-rich sensory protein [Candidatus Andersenbacteria bacterium]|nr:tryptophan-rich sensory protein [Candidatus Andersenbacteria bacterium]MBI3250851.1 tryptophan-rich sensory protein [Candidatus Andersenbacteria bacterium]
MNRLLKCGIALALPLAAGLIGSLFTAPEIPTWYVTLMKPSFSPPNWLFAPVWTGLYILMGIAFYRIWSRNGSTALFSIHLIVNVLWSFLFFGLHSPLLGLLDIVILLTMIVTLILQFYKTDRTAAFLLVPYAAWVMFATVLNFAIWRLN